MEEERDRFHKKGFLMLPYEMYQCAFCKLYLQSSYPRFIEECPRCGNFFLAYVVPKFEVLDEDR